jgi:serine/threonine protein phosphatase PrpC
MIEAKNTQRAVVRIGYDGRVHKEFRGQNAAERLANEVKVLRYLEAKQCPFVPRVLEFDAEHLRLVTTNCGARVEQMGEDRMKEIFAELESYGVRHDDPFLRNITYRATDGRFCVIDFEFATIIGPPLEAVSDDSSKSDDGVVQNLRWSGKTDPGRFRPNNEDAFLAIQLDYRDVRYLGRIGEASLGNADYVFAVSDGMGGERSGEVASRIAREKITLLLPRRFKLSPHLLHSCYEEILNELFDSIHKELTKLGVADLRLRNMGATLSLGWFTRGWMFYGHIGDSRIYHFQGDGSMSQITEDHSHVGWLRRQGKLNEREARMHPRKNVLEQALGAGHQHIKPQFGAVRWQPGDKFLLCTDGIIDGLWDRAVQELIQDPPARLKDIYPGERLVAEAVSESGRDNATAVVVELC